MVSSFVAPTDTSVCAACLLVIQLRLVCVLLDQGSPSYYVLSWLDALVIWERLQPSTRIYQHWGIHTFSESHIPEGVSCATLTTVWVTAPDSRKSEVCHVCPWNSYTFARMSRRWHDTMWKHRGVHSTFCVESLNRGKG